MNSSSTLIKSPLAIVPIPDNENTDSPAPTDPKLSCKVYDNFVNAIGLWATPSIEIIALDSFLSIVSVCALPVPADEKLIAVPASALFLVVANLNSSDPLLIAYTVVGILLPPVCILVAVTPEKEDPNA